MVVLYFCHSPRFDESSAPLVSCDPSSPPSPPSPSSSLSCGMGDPVGDGFHASDCGDWLAESENGTLLLHMTSTLSARAVFGVKAPSSQSFTRLSTLQKLGFGDFDLALGPERGFGLLVRRALDLSLAGESLAGTARLSDMLDGGADVECFCCLGRLASAAELQVKERSSPW